MNHSLTVPPSNCCTTNERLNVGRNEQVGSLLAGGGLIAYGLMPKSKFRLLSLIAGASLIYRGVSGHCEIYQRLGVDTAQDEKQPGVANGQGRKIVSSVHINRDRRDLYDLWRNLSNLPNVMRHLQSVTPLDDQRSRWVALGPFEQTLEWEAEIITDRPGEMIAWQSLPTIDGRHAEVDNAGSVHFNHSATGDGTELQVSIKYDPPGGWAVAKLASAFGQGLQQELDEDLRRFKQMMETGEAATSAMNGAH